MANWRARTRRLGVPIVAVLAMAIAAAPAAAQRERPPNRIVGGTPAAEGAWPAHGFLSIQLGPTTFAECGGTLVSGRSFLTAAHCVTDETTGLELPADAFAIGMGDNRVSEITDVYGVLDVVVHESYAPLLTGEDNDVALLRLDRAAPYRPLGLIAGGQQALWAPGQSATIIGWGVTQTAADPVDDLQEAQVPIRPDATCANAYAPGVYDAAVMLCAGDALRDTCSGDSGGPIMVPRGRRFALVGVTSFGPDPCANENAPGVYTRMGATALNQWVRDRIPTAAIGGATTGVAGQPVSLSATASPAPTGFDWDLDEDGAFDDATGAQIAPTLAAGEREVSVQATYANGDRAVAERLLTVSTAPPDPPPPDPPPPDPPPPDPPPTTPPGPAPSTPTPAAPPATPPTGGPRLDGVPLAPPSPAKLEVARASVLRSERRLSVLAPITRRASGDVQVRFRAAGRTTRFAAPIRDGRVRFSRRISRAQAAIGSGILTLRYAGDADTQAQEVRLRAATRQARLRAGRPTIDGGGRLRAAGTLANAARGVVRLQLVFSSGGRTITEELHARISGGRYRFDTVLPSALRAQIVGRNGVVHSYTLFTGYLPARLRGEMASFEVLGAP